LYNHTGINDKTLAEFVINLHEQSKSYDEFKQSLLQGGEFPDYFIETLDRLIRTLKPKARSKKQKSEWDEDDNIADEKAKMFPGLALKNDPSWREKKRRRHEKR